MEVNTSTTYNELSKGTLCVCVCVCAHICTQRGPQPSPRQPAFPLVLRSPRETRVLPPGRTSEESHAAGFIPGTARAPAWEVASAAKGGAEKPVPGADRKSPLCADTALSL